MTVVALTSTTSSSPRLKGSITDIVTLQDYPFEYEPVWSDKEKTTYGSRDIIGNRLPSLIWVGQGSSDLDLDIFLLGPTIEDDLDNIRQFLLPQDDIGAPHPVYLNLGDLYLGRWFVVEETERKYPELQIDMTPHEVRVRIKLKECPVGSTFTGTGA